MALREGQARAKEQKEKMNQTRIPRVILVVEEDRNEREVLSSHLREEGYLVLAVTDARTALDIAHSTLLSLLILDGALFPTGGLDLCRFLHSCRGRSIPILLEVKEAAEIPLLRRGETPVDDYIVKPFLREELSACVQALLHAGKRREHYRSVKASWKTSMGGACEEEALLTADDLSIDLARRRVVWHGHPLEIRRALLFELLVYLVRHRGRVLTQHQLLTHVWGYTDAEVAAAPTRTVSVHVHWLRELLQDTGAHPKCIETVRGVGYRFNA